MLGVEGCGREELRIWFFRSSNSARRASMAALSRERGEREGEGKGEVREEGGVKGSEGEERGKIPCS